ncbi:LppX_LprAFG lipoprotein [Nocardioides caldifontis]|uniref:LppX_LprAFG lipoprotein n=1 Tax=Nocardioides caldifontis TaxID=2588938 RepID=UPI0011DF207F|nr:LppX_LprAFG lipoprotein [Nocardioides caldifontis]
MTSTPPARMAAAVPLLLLALVTGCSDDEGDGGGEANEDPLAEAKTQLDETSGVSISLVTEKLPDGVNGVLSAVGVGTHDPAFEGDLKVRANGFTVDVPVVSVDGTVWAELPFTNKFNKVDPGDYGAPDPAALMHPEAGLSSWLTAVEDAEEGDAVREGEKVLTPYSGTLPGQAVAEVIPSADEAAEFEVTFRLDDDDRLESAEIVGPFYGDQGDVEYALTLTDYGTEKDITAP